MLPWTKQQVDVMRGIDYCESLCLLGVLLLQYANSVILYIVGYRLFQAAHQFHPLNIFENWLKGQVNDFEHRFWFQVGEAYLPISLHEMDTGIGFWWSLLGNLDN